MKSSPFFDEAWLAEQRQKLEAEKVRLERELAVHGKKVGPRSEDYAAAWPEYGADEESNIAEMADYQANLNVEATLVLELGRVEAAWQRMADGRYGIDIKTGEPIDRKRLEAYPVAETNV